MTHVMQPELYHVGQWKAGQAPVIDSCLVVVTHDQTSHAYVIGKDQYDNFCEWVCYEWIDSFYDDYMSVDDALLLHDIRIKRTNLEDV